jgi:hypothetical protein
VGLCGKHGGGGGGACSSAREGGRRPGPKTTNQAAGARFLQMIRGGAHDRVAGTCVGWGKHKLRQ